jgi:predicted dehydrogenase
MRIAIIGCGLIGRKRALALGSNLLVAAADTDFTRAENLAAQHPGCVATENWKSVTSDRDIDVVIVATTNDWLTPVALSAIRNGKHVLVEKPAARNTSEIRQLMMAAQDSRVVVKVGFNHRFHPAFEKSRQLLDEGGIGRLMYIRARYGHGGRLGYEKEWRANPEIAGGGEMLDQGVHLIDLSRWFAGEFPEVHGTIGTFFWPMSVEDNGFAMLKTAGGQIAWLHASCTEWKNLFSFEIFGRDGKLQIDGLGGSYGMERLTFYKMLPEMGPPQTTTWEFPGEDLSWSAEFAHFADCISQQRTPSGNLEDACAALEIIEKLYRQPGTKQ